MMKKHTLREKEHLHEKTWPREIPSQATKKSERKNAGSTSFTSHPGGNLVDGLPPASSMNPWGSQSPENERRNHPNMMKNISCENVDFRPEIIFS